MYVIIKMIMKVLLYIKLFFKEVFTYLAALPLTLRILFGNYIEESEVQFFNFLISEDGILSFWFVFLIIAGFRIWNEAYIIEGEVLKNRVKGLIEIKEANPQIGEYKDLYKDIGEALENLRNYMLGSKLNEFDKYLIGKIYLFLYCRDNRSKADEILSEIKELLQM